MEQTSILVRVQALGGKFLGPDIGYAYVTIRDVVSGDVLAQGVAAGDSGTIKPSPPTPQCTNSPIIAGDYYWLYPGATSASFRATFDLSQSLLIEITAAATVNGAPSTEHIVSTRMWLPAGAQIDDPGVLLIMPGLNVQILQPNPQQAHATTFEVEAWVTMMCGCKISSDGAGVYWPQSQFFAFANVVDMQGNALFGQQLAFDASKQSTYRTNLTLDPGEYQLFVTAMQPSRSNWGSASTYISVPYSG